MSEGFKSTSSEPQWSGGNGFKRQFSPSAKKSDDTENEAGRALIVGVLGGLLSAAGYLIYRRLPDEQKERLHEQVRAQIQSRIAEVRANFNI
ncbi:MAG TPA: hypothetical protein VIK27_04205 [Candidatus Aquilonibacter sp.]